MAHPSIKLREKRVRELVKRGHATGDEMIVAQFGEMPRGLHQDTPLTDTMTFHKVREDIARSWLAKGLNIAELGYILPEPERRIYINHFMMGPFGRVLGLAATRMAVGRVHDLAEAYLETLFGKEGLALYIGAPLFVATLLSSFRYAMISSLNKALFPSMADVAGEEFMHTLALKGDEVSWSLANAFRANAEDMMKNDPSKLRRGWTDIKRGLDMLFTLMPIGHFQQDHEIMGRAFNLAARGYHVHGRLAENATEGSAFLMDLGVKTSIGFRIEFNEAHYDALKNTFYKHKMLTGLFLPPSAEINIGINSYRNKAVLDMYCKDAFPVMLGEMHYLLGDSQGLERFGFDSQNRDMKGVPQPLRPDADESTEPLRLEFSK